jgi:hypothetical protein
MNMDDTVELGNCPKWQLTPYAIAKGYAKSTDALLGFVPLFLSVTDPRPAAKQFDERYAHGGGWHPFSGFFRLSNEEDNWDLGWSDERYHALAYTRLLDEVIVYYDLSWVAIFQPDGSFEVIRMD